MGQKVNPIGFRIGINKPYNSTWFANFRKYSQILQEDHKVHNFFKQEWGPFYEQIGFFKLEIRRRVNKLELLVYANNSKAIYKNLQKKELKVYDFESKLKSFLKKNTVVQIIACNVPRLEMKSILIANQLIRQIQNRTKVKKAIQDAKKQLQKDSIHDFKMQISGRLNGAEIATTEISRSGCLPLHTIRAKINYHSCHAYTKHGVLGIKV